MTSDKVGDDAPPSAAAGGTPARCDTLIRPFGMVRMPPRKRARQAK
jgi:hypothetical protein